MSSAVDIDYGLLVAVISGIATLLILILFFKIQAFIALLIASITVGLVAGMSPSEVVNNIQQGMGSTLGFVALVVGLGAIFGAILEQSGGAEALADYLLRKFGDKNASWALMLTGFLVAIPVFFDVAFIILIPMIYSLQRRTKKSLLFYAIPLLAGLAITHSFIPPTPGPIAVADILKADLGWVILLGVVVGIPTAIVCGPLFAKFIAKQIHVEAPSLINPVKEKRDYPAVIEVFLIIGIPILLIVSNTFFNSPLGDDVLPKKIKTYITLIGNPFIALIIANLIAWYVLGIKKGLSKESMLTIATKSMEPIGVIILLTGAGGVFKQMLIETKSGEMLANYFMSIGLSTLFFGFLAAAIVRILQGSATVAMITAAGITAPLLIGGDISQFDKAMLVIAIASGASIMSHVNDSGFWLVGKYLRLTEAETFRSWTVMTTLLSITSFTVLLILSLIF